MESPDTLFEHYSLPGYDRSRRPVEEPGSAIGSNKYIVATDSVLVSRLNPFTPRVWLPEVSNNNRAICSTEFMVLRPRLHVSRSYLYFHARSDRFRTSLTALVTGTSKSHQRARADDVMSLPVLVPAPDLLRQFNDAIGALVARLTGLGKAGAKLAKMRDTALPVLLGGHQLETRQPLIWDLRYRSPGPPHRAAAELRERPVADAQAPDVGVGAAFP